MFEKKFGIGGLMGAAALAACSPQAEKAPAEGTPQEQALRQIDAETVGVVETETVVPDTYTPEETWAKSGMPSTAEELQELDTQEVDGEGGIPPKMSE